LRDKKISFSVGSNLARQFEIIPDATLKTLSDGILAQLAMDDCFLFSLAATERRQRLHALKQDLNISGSVPRHFKWAIMTACWVEKLHLPLLQSKDSTLQRLPQALQHAK
jgi:hypothetical protein